MSEQSGELAEDIKRLQHCINDLVSVLALPAMWSGAEPSQIAHTLLEALLRMLQLDLVYVRLTETGEQSPIEMVRFARSQKQISAPPAHEIGDLFKQWLGADAQEWPPLMRNRLGDRDISIVPLGLGLQGQIGLIVAGAERADFPRQTERLILSVAANQASILLQEARLLSEQKRIASELDRRVAQRTAELATANEELRKEIADRKHVEEDLRSSEEKHRVIVEAANDAVVSMDEKGDIFLANPATKRIFGYDPVEIVGKPLTMLMPESMRRLHDNGYKRYLATGERHLDWHGVEVTALRKNGQEFPVEVSFGEMTSDGHKIFTGFIRDISEKKKADEALRNIQAQLSRATRTATVGEFAASIAHEINQPLAAVVANGHACLRWLSAGPSGLAKAQEAAERIIRDGKEAGEVVRRIRALFKHTPLEKIDLDLNEVISEVLRLFAGEASKRGVTMETELGDDLETVEGDRVQLQQLLFNLLLNGIEAMDPVLDCPKKLFIRSKRHNPETILVEIQDSGVGMEDSEKVFEAFFTTKEHGMGMGLAICRSIIDAHHGRLWAASGNGAGTTFSFTLPVQSSTAL
jgi:PAS domain S-box-containing protein